MTTEGMAAGASQVRLHCIYSQDRDEFLSSGPSLTLLYSG